MKTYYEILEVDKNASLDIIKKIYKYKIKIHHPDLFSGEDKVTAENITKKLNEAYAVLSDTEKRKEYDNLINANLTNDILKENVALKQEIEILKLDILEKDLLIKDFLGKNTSNISANDNDIPYSKTNFSDSFMKNLFLNIYYSFKDVFLKPFLFIIILFILLLLLSSIIE